MTTVRCHQLHLLLLLVAVWLVSSPAPSHAGLEDKLEKSLGSQVSREMEQQIGLVRDPLLNEWVARIGNRLVSVSSRKDVDYKFKILDSEDINAVAVPGGHIYVTKGLLRFIESEDELAAVIGHEVGHIAAKHSNKQIKTQILTSLALSTIKNRKYSTVVGAARLGGMFAMLKFSRDDELDADLMGLQEVTALGYDSDRMLDFFKRLDDKQKKKPSRFEVYLMTHPTFKDRMAKLRDRPEMKPSPERLVAVANNLKDRSLANQARRQYRQALSLQPDYSPALSGLAALDAQASGVDPGIFQPLAIEQGSSAPRDLARSLNSLGSKMDLLEKKEKSLSKQVRSMASALNVISNYLNPYDPIATRAFDTAVQALNDIDRTVGGLRTLIDNSRLAAIQFSQLDSRFTQTEQDASLRQLSDRFSGAAPAAIDGIAGSVTEAIHLSKQISNTASSVEFAIRQMQGTLLSPGPAGLMLSGAAELQLRSADEAAAKQMKVCRQLLNTEEQARSLALQTAIDLHAVELKVVSKDQLRNLIAGYTRGKWSLVHESSSSEATGSVSVETSKASGQQQPQDFGCVNILLQIIIHDIEREAIAGGVASPFALSTGKQ